jgi:hypothetical protein
MIVAVVGAAAFAVAAGAAEMSCPAVTTETKSTATMTSSVSAVPVMSVPAIGVASSTGVDAYLAVGDPMSGKFEKVHGTIGVKARDLSDIKSTASADALDYGLARIHVPSTDSNYEIRFTGLDKSSDMSSFGGVGLMKTVFGDSGFGPSDMPKTVAYEAVFGLVSILKNGKQIAANVPAHIMVLPGLFDTSSEKLVASADDIDYSTRQIVLHVPGPVEGLPNNNLTVGWANAALNLTDVGGKALNNAQVASLVLPGETRIGGVVAGEAVEVMPHAVRVSLTDDGFRFPGRAGIDAGYYTFSVTNNSSINRGFLIRGKDRVGADFERYTQLLKPGETTTLSVYLPLGSYQLVEFHQDLMGGQLRWFSNYNINLSVRAM